MSKSSIVDRLAGYFLHEIGDSVALLAQRYPKDSRSLLVDWTDLARWDPDLAEDILDDPGQLFDYVDEALRRVALPVDLTLGRAEVRFQNLPPEQTVSPGEFSPKERRGELLAFEAQVAKRTQVKPRLVEAAFECQRCGTMTHISQPRGEFIDPIECLGCDMQGPFRLNTDQSEYEDYQRILLENPASVASGGDTAKIMAHLSEDLAGHAAIEACQDVILTGSLEFENAGPVPSPVITGNAIEAAGMDAADIDFDADQLDLFERLRDRPESFVEDDDVSTAEVLMRAAAPKFVAGSHPRDQQVVRGLVLQLVSASTFDARDGSHYRGDIHVLLPGDPGTGKSVLAKWMAAVAPRSAFASGERSSGPGLTASAVKDEFSEGGFSIQPGALVKANGGIAVIDELDKADEGAIEKMHSALADQIIPVSLAGQSTELPAECGLLGVCNPAGGHFKGGAEELADALALESPLLSRFDLVMQMRSKQDREHIRELSEEMLQNWSAALQDHLGQPLDEDDQERIDGILSLEDYRAVITRARQLHPQPASEAVIDELSDWFTRQKMALPERYQDAYSDAEGRYEGPPLPVTARKLGAARRIAQASARANLREEVTLGDVEVAKEMVSRSLNDLDIPTVHNGGVGGGDVSTTDQSRPSGIST